MSLKRDAQTFLDLTEANKGIIYKVANAYCRNEENKQDLIQEIILQLWLSFGKYDAQYSLTTWMYRIALNVSISFYRKERLRHEINQPMPEGIFYLQEAPAASGKDVEQLYLFIKTLKEIDRAIILLYLEEKSQQEIAAILGLTATNISTKVARIKQELRQKFTSLKP